MNRIKMINELSGEVKLKKWELNTRGSADFSCIFEWITNYVTIALN